MSYDVTTIDPQTGEASDVSWNYTYNIRPALATVGLRSINDLYGYGVRTAAVLIRSIVAALVVREVEIAAAHNPSNGWGSVETVIPALLNLARQLEARPDHETVHVS